MSESTYLRDIEDHQQASFGTLEVYGDADMSTSIHGVKAEFFRTLGHPVRVRILEALREGERSVGELQSALGLDSGGASQHLAVLRRQGLLDNRKEGTSVLYRVKDPRTFQLLEIARQILSAQFEETQALLEDLAAPAASPVPGGERRL